MFYVLVYNKYTNSYAVLTSAAFTRFEDNKNLNFELVKKLGYIEGTVNYQSIIDSYTQLKTTTVNVKNTVEATKNTLDNTAGGPTGPDETALLSTLKKKS